MNIVAIELMLGLPPFVFPPSPLREKGVAHAGSVVLQVNAGKSVSARAQQPSCIGTVRCINRVK